MYLVFDLEKNHKKISHEAKNEDKKREQALIVRDFQYFAYSPKVVYFTVIIALSLRVLRKFNTNRTIVLFAIGHFVYIM